MKDSFVKLQLMSPTYSFTGISTIAEVYVSRRWRGCHIWRHHVTAAHSSGCSVTGRLWLEHRGGGNNEHLSGWSFHCNHRWWVVLYTSIFLKLIETCPSTDDLSLKVISHYFYTLLYLCICRVSTLEFFLYECKVYHYMHRNRIICMHIRGFLVAVKYNGSS